MVLERPPSPTPYLPSQPPTFPSLPTLKQSPPSPLPSLLPLPPFSNDVTRGSPFPFRVPIKDPCRGPDPTLVWISFLDLHPALWEIRPDFDMQNEKTDVNEAGEPGPAGALVFTSQGDFTKVVWRRRYRKNRATSTLPEGRQSTLRDVWTPASDEAKKPGKEGTGEGPSHSQNALRDDTLEETPPIRN